MIRPILAHRRLQEVATYATCHKHRHDALYMILGYTQFNKVSGRKMFVLSCFVQLSTEHNDIMT